MDRIDVAKTAENFVKNHANLTDSTAEKLWNGATRNAHEQIADDLAKLMMNVPEKQRESLYKAIGEAGEAISGENAAFSWDEKTKRLNVNTAYYNWSPGFNHDVKETMNERAKLTGFGCNGGW